MALDPKLFPSEVKTLNRSEINLCDYNPRLIDEEGRKALRRSLRKFGTLGGIIVNARNGNRVCSGNQKVAILDSIKGFPENDYELRVEVVDVDDKTEKEIVVVMNNQNVGGKWDFDRLREMIPEIDYKNVGFTDADLSVIGVDFDFQSEGEAALTDDLADLMAPLDDFREQEATARREEARLQRDNATADLDAVIEDDDIPGDDEGDEDEPRELTREEKIAKVKGMKQQILQGAAEKAANMDAYFMVSFSDWEAKADFLQSFGYDPYSKFIKGEDLQRRIEGVEVDEKETEN
ncbi:MAG: DNA methylase [Bacteroidales bacterium]|nr:DNA methylase [Bacteroidales bacterium]